MYYDGKYASRFDAGCRQHTKKSSRKAPADWIVLQMPLGYRQAGVRGVALNNIKSSLKQCELTIDPTFLIRLMNGLALSQITDQHRGERIMKTCASSDAFAIVVCIAILAEVSASVVSPDIVSENACAPE